MDKPQQEALPGHRALTTVRASAEILRALMVEVAEMVGEVAGAVMGQTAWHPTFMWKAPPRHLSFREATFHWLPETITRQGSLYRHNRLLLLRIFHASIPMWISPRHLPVRGTWEREHQRPFNSVLPSQHNIIYWEEKTSFMV